MSMPLHPVLVHLPLALALLMPLFAALAAWALWTGRIGRRTWLAVAALQLLLVGTAVVAMKSGEQEEDRVEAVVPGAALHLHEEYAEQFTWGAAAVLGLTLLAFIPAAARGVALVSLAGTLVVAGLALRVGHAGGELVYVHNAGSAYGAPAGQRAAGAKEGSPKQAQANLAGAESSDDDEDER